MSGTAIFTRFSVFLTVIIVWYFGFFWIAIPLSLWYLYNYPAYELIAVGVLIDGHFMTTFGVPYYTLFFLSAHILMALIKPRLRTNTFV
jgi:hypothetical protein